MREEQGLGFGAILRDQQPARQPLEDRVESMTQDRLRELIEEGMRILRERDVERCMAAAFGPQDIGRDAEGLASDLHHGIVGCEIDVQDEGQSDHPVMAGHRHFNRLSPLSGRQERHQAADRKISVPELVASLREDVTSRERDPLDVRQQSLVRIAGHTGEESVLGGHRGQLRGESDCCPTDCSASLVESVGARRWPASPVQRIDRG